MGDQTSTAATTNQSAQVWPGAFGIYKRSKEAMMVNIGSFLGLLGAYIVASIVVSIIMSALGMDSDSFGRNIVDLFLGSAFTVIFVNVVMAGIRNQKMDFNTALKSCFSILTLKMVGLTILTAFMLIGSLLLLIVPFFFVFPRIALSYYFLVDKNMGIFDSISASWNATKGSSGKVWGITGVSILFALAILVLVGIYLSIMYAAAYGLLYVYLTSGQKATLANA
jgi:hypothetical protein